VQPDLRRTCHGLIRLLSLKKAGPAGAFRFAASGLETILVPELWAVIVECGSMPGTEPPHRTARLL
jgi:hypothetical protein